MKNESKIAPGQINGFLDRSTSVTGDLRFNDTFRIDGRLVGTVVSDNVLIVGEGAYVNADMEVRALAVMGTVTGRVVASERIEIHPGGRLEADVVTPALAIADGAIFQGFCDMDGSVLLAEEAEVVPLMLEAGKAG